MRLRDRSVSNRQLSLGPSSDIGNLIMMAAAQEVVEREVQEFPGIVSSSESELEGIQVSQSEKQLVRPELVVNQFVE